MVGSVIPSSKVLIDKMLAPVDWDNTRLFVEYGPGVGTFTRPILDQLGPDARLIAIDTNPDFVALPAQDDPRPAADRGPRLGRRCRADHRRTWLRACRLRRFGPALLDPSAGVGEAIGEATAKAIRGGGAFLIYQFSPKVRDFIAPYFERIERGFEWINVPPATLFWAWREPTRPERLKRVTRRRN